MLKIFADTSTVEVRKKNAAATNVRFGDVNDQSKLIRQPWLEVGQPH
jgi:hypothetical protein